METFGQGCPPVPVQRIESKQPMLALQTGVAVVERHIAALAAVELQGPKRSTFKPISKERQQCVQQKISSWHIQNKEYTLCELTSACPIIVLFVVSTDLQCSFATFSKGMFLYETIFLETTHNEVRASYTVLHDDS